MVKFFWQNSRQNFKVAVNVTIIHYFNKSLFSKSLEPGFSNGLPRFKTAIFRHSRRGGEGIIEKLCQAATTKNGGIIALKKGNSLLNTGSKQTAQLFG